MNDRQGYMTTQFMGNRGRRKAEGRIKRIEGVPQI